MENLFKSPKPSSTYSSKSAPHMIRAALSELDIQNCARLTQTPLFKSESSGEKAFLLETFENSSPTFRAQHLPLDLIINASKSSSKRVSDVLNSIRSKSTKSILKHQSQPSHKNVHFSEMVKEPETETNTENKTQSIATTNNSVTESRYEVNEEEKNEFKYEEEVKASVLIQEFDEYPTVIFCKECKREQVTVVELEKVRPDKGILAMIVWGICWCLPPCVYHETELVHRCSACFVEMVRISNF